MSNIILDKIIWEKRKTLVIRVNFENEVIAKAPYFLSKKLVMEFAESKREWIEKKKAENLIAIEKTPKFEFREGAVYRVFDKEYRLEYRDDLARDFETDEANFSIKISCRAAEKVGEAKIIKAWHKEIARRELSEILCEKAESMGVAKYRLKISDARTRWGSRSAKGNINLNWRLILLPKNLAEYIAIHELAHVFEMNHSKNFWKIVERHCPNWKEAEKELKSYGSFLNADF